MQAIDIMSAPVVSITPQTPVLEVAALLMEHHIGGVPVLDQGKVVGVVNEFELLRRSEIGTDHSTPRRSWWLQLLERDPRPGDYVKSHAQRASDLMTRQVVSVTEDAPVQKIASIFAARAVRRIVVLREQQLVGIITRADLVHALAQTPVNRRVPRTQSDETIRVRLLTELENQPWWHPSLSVVCVEDGIVQYRGVIENEDERQAARVAAENVPGVRGVEDTRAPWGNWAMY